MWVAEVKRMLRNWMVGSYFASACRWIHRTWECAAGRIDYPISLPIWIGRMWKNKLGGWSCKTESVRNIEWMRDKVRFIGWYAFFQIIQNDEVARFRARDDRRSDWFVIVIVVHEIIIHEVSAFVHGWQLIGSNRWREMSWLVSMGSARVKCEICNWWILQSKRQSILWGMEWKKESRWVEQRERVFELSYLFMMRGVGCRT